MAVGLLILNSIPGFGSQGKPNKAPRLVDYSRAPSERPGRVDNSRRVKHTALIDCELLYKVYINLIDQKEPMLNFQTKNENGLDTINRKTKDYFKKIIVPTKEELKLHKKFLKNSLKKNFFN
mgnify:CR=1 FL=1